MLMLLLNNTISVGIQ